ncbi:BMC domain-containing protein [Clostridium sp. HBUAS56010]|uniref:BMC domain-containing protein n=1 Tax=Clostridium sp. HBUAS56010 TaxID=2571127 RepID=UPI00242B4F84|nr:BMC domain-containing protein [Clostridium sp. HBUAS56010]
MKQALGLVEIQGLSTAVLVADAMVKSANVTILEIENTKGQGYMTVKVAGDVGAVNAAVSAGKQTGLENQKLVSFKVIARPADSVDQIFGASKNLKAEIPPQPSASSDQQEQTDKKPEAVKEVLLKEEAVKEEAVKAEAVKAEAVKIEPVKEESVKEEPSKEEAVKPEPVKAEPVKEQPSQQPRKPGSRKK